METFTLTDTTHGVAAEPVDYRADPQRDWVENLQGELDAYYIKLRELNKLDPVSVFQTVSSFSARASEMRSQLMRVNTNRCTSFRQRQIDPFLEECDRQFKIHSRIQSIRDLEFRINRGEF